MYDTYNSYRPGFLGVGTLGILGALILPLIAIALPPPNNGQHEQDGELAAKNTTQEESKLAAKKGKQDVATEFGEDNAGIEESEVASVRKL